MNGRKIRVCHGVLFSGGSIRIAGGVEIAVFSCEKAAGIIIGKYNFFQERVCNFQRKASFVIIKLGERVFIISKLLCAPDRIIIELYHRPERHLNRFREAKIVINFKFRHNDKLTLTPPRRTGSGMRYAYGRLLLKNR